MKGKKSQASRGENTGIFVEFGKLGGEFLTVGALEDGSCFIETTISHH